MYKGIALAVLGVALAGCANLPATAPMVRWDRDNGYRYVNLTKTEVGGENSQDLFVVLTFSGGGTRAAALAFGAMEKLRDTRIVWRGRDRSLLDEVDVIGGVSTGSIPAAYYAAFGDRIFEDLPAKLLYRDVHKDLLAEFFSPFRWPGLMSGRYGRSDIAAEYYDAKIFRGATYGDLMVRGRRPYLVIHATDMATQGAFAFTQAQFDPICADLSRFPLARAVAASSAYPVLLTPITLRNRAGGCGFPESRGTAAGGPITEESGSVKWQKDWEKVREIYNDSDVRPYIHLVDGGIADFVGLRTTLDELDRDQGGWRFMDRAANGGIKKFVVIAVDARTVNALADGGDPDSPGIAPSLETIFDRLVAMNGAGGPYLRNWLRGKGFPESPPHTYFVRLAFEDIPDAARRARFNRIATDLVLPAGDVDALRQIAGELLDASPDFRQLKLDLGAPVIAAAE